MRKRALQLSLLLSFVLLSVPGYAACDLQFVGPDASAYGKAELRKFVDEQVRPKLSMAPSAFDITINVRCAAQPVKAVVLKFDATDYYITHIMGRLLSKEEATYQTTPLTISATMLETELLRAYDINNLSVSDIQDVVKMLAFFFAETARFTDVETITTAILSGNCRAHWLDYATLVRRWGRMSRLALHENNTQGAVRGGAQNNLIAPITKERIDAYNAAIAEGKNGPDSHYVDPRDWDKSVVVPPALCKAGPPQ